MLQTFSEWKVANGDGLYSDEHSYIYDCDDDCDNSYGDSACVYADNHH